MHKNFAPIHDKQYIDNIQKDFVANVSHELRTPLTVLIGYIETMQQHADLEPQWQKALTQMWQHSQRMNNLINDLLLLSRLENDEIPQICTKIDMSKLLIQLFDDAQAYNQSFEHLIHLRLDSQKDIMGYEENIISAFSNIINNAIKYTPKSGEIIISWEDVEHGAIFSVEDNGMGIEPQHLERLTERFYRVDNSRSRETGGTGLGLSIVHHVLNQHHAQLTITSEVGKGSKFSIFFLNTI